MKKNFVEVAIDLPIRKTFTYSIPDRIKEKISPGARVLAPFRNLKKVGYVVGFCDSSKVKNIRAIIDLIDDEPIFEKDLLQLAKWLSEYYFCSMGEALGAAIPSYIKKGKRLDYVQRKTLSQDEALHKISDPLFKEPPTLTLQQKETLSFILNAVDNSIHKVFLLHGITGSGKTEVYLQAIERIVKLNRSSIFLVPEISLTPQTMSRFNARFKGLVAILHSRLSPGERFAQWKKIKNGDAKIVVGARSAIFAPVKNLGLIVLDEEHETTYKQEVSPRYHAREAAIERARLCGAVVILGSATPSVESFYNAQQKKFKLLSLTERVEDKTLPEVEIVDMRGLKSKEDKILSRQLQKAIFDILDSKQQAMLFLNRRGFSTFINCRKCGFVLKCKSCSVTLRFHQPSKKLFCHWCNFEMDPPQICPKCKSSYIKYFGIGTQKVESELARLFPQARIGRMDTDATKLKGSHFKILGEFKQGNIDVLIGTQMIAKGLDFPNVTLVGVISADTSLNLPDFRSGERTFNLLTQVAGRAGRGDIKGKVIIQTYAPSHYAINTARQHDFLDFYQKELSQRKALFLPPFSHLVNIIVSSRSNKKAKINAEGLAELIRKNVNKKNVIVLGPAQPPIPKLRNRFRWRILLKAKDNKDNLKVLESALCKFNKEKDARILVDVDPI